MISDQRTSHRVSFFMGADVYRSPQGQKVGRAVVRDLSVSGMRLETLDALKQGETIFVDFNVAGKFDFQKTPATVTRVYRHSGSFLAGLTLQRGDDRRRMRQALAFVVESSM
jgi:hypothetical protein